MIEQIVSADRVRLNAAEVAAYTDFACELADLAGAEILPYFRTAVTVENKVGENAASEIDNAANNAASNAALAPSAAEFDPVTIADKSAESVIRRMIRQTYPDHGILGEEHGFESGKSGLTWVLDPIDGTRAFITGLPLWGCLIALFDGAEPVLGVMDQPFLRERYVGTGTAAFCSEGNNTVTLKTRNCEVLADAVMMTTSPDMFKSRGEQLAFYRLASGVRMQRFGGDCYAYCMLARGFVDLVVEADLEPYDIQALIPIVHGAGGVLTNWQGGSARAGGQVVAAATPELHRLALAELAH